MKTDYDTRLADYEILRETGRGAMSTVYEALDTRDGRTVALKVLFAPASLRPEQQRALIARLGREARLISRLSHPNIVRIFDVGESDGRHYLAMEYLHGTTLRGRLDAGGPLPMTEASLVLDQVAAALDAIHAQQIVHRDVKPSNVMILPDGHVKLMDFGVARQGDDTTITQTGMIVGSPAYMSPEQILGDSGSPASDLWALGVLLYEMLSGKSPFPGNNIPAVLYKVTHDPPPPIPGLPPEAQQVLRRALEKKPNCRYRTARLFADAFRATLFRPALSQYERPWASLLPGWPRVVLPACALLAVIVSTLMLTHASGRFHSAPYAMATTPPRMRTLPGGDAPPPPRPTVTIRELPTVARVKLYPKPPHAYHKPVKPVHRVLSHQALKAQHAWARHLKRLAARRSAHHRRTLGNVRRLRRSHYHTHFVPRTTAPDYLREMPAHPVYNPGSPV